MVNLSKDFIFIQNKQKIKEQNMYTMLMINVSEGNLKEVRQVFEHPFNEINIE